MSNINYKAAEALIESAPRQHAAEYEKYFDTIKPMTTDETFRRGIFAFASVHTTWESNIKLYALLWDFEVWQHDPEKLRELIVESRAGLVNGRTKNIMKFTAMYWQYPELFEKKEDETWYKYRDRIMETVSGLGVAKAAFFIELMHFQDSRVSCFDTHMLQTYGIKPPDVGNVKPPDMARMEMHWDLTCEKYDVNPVTCRWILWDIKQDKPNSRYWSYVLEGKPTIEGDPQLELFTGKLKKENK
jgi:thermostable 8-oxoguanine DNA glycosylase